ncbi:hypothetical protein F5X96DRAFT_225701 [Biscogniauxia mediterranea]|nr:hypothetical protein F5X96DRAFT_225701 [Biscogniauxia mediterranea]
MVEDDVDVVLVTQLPADSWIEGLAVRPNNHILAASLAEPVVYNIDAEDPDAVPEPVCTFPGVGAALNLCPIPGRSDEYTVITAEISDVVTARWETFAVWHMKVNADGSAVATKMGDVPDVVLALGLCPVTERFVLVADSARTCIQCLDVTTGKSTVLLADDESMKAKDAEAFFGVNRVCIVDGYIWYSNYSVGSIHRVPYELDESHPELPLRITGPVEMMTDDLSHCDGFQVLPDASAAYTINYMEGTLVKTVLKKDTQSIQIMDKLVSPTGVEMGKGPDGKPKLFVVCCGEIEVGWLNDSVSWKDIANIAATTVEVTVSSDQESP